MGRLRSARLPRPQRNQGRGGAADLDGLRRQGKVLDQRAAGGPGRPRGVIAAHINPESGLRDPEDRQGLVEYFFQENLPPEGEAVLDAASPRAPAGDEVKSELPSARDSREQQEWPQSTEITERIHCGVAWRHWGRCVQAHSRTGSSSFSCSRCALWLVCAVLVGE